MLSKKITNKRKINKTHCDQNCTFHALHTLSMFFSFFFFFFCRFRTLQQLLLINYTKLNNRSILITSNKVRKVFSLKLSIPVSIVGCIKKRSIHTDDKYRAFSQGSSNSSCRSFVFQFWSFRLKFLLLSTWKNDIKKSQFDVWSRLKQILTLKIL